MRQKLGSRHPCANSGEDAQWNARVEASSGGSPPQPCYAPPPSELGTHPSYDRPGSRGPPRSHSRPPNSARCPLRAVLGVATRPQLAQRARRRGARGAGGACVMACACLLRRFSGTRSRATANGRHGRRPRTPPPRPPACGRRRAAGRPAGARRLRASSPRQARRRELCPRRPHRPRC